MRRTVIPLTDVVRGLLQEAGEGMTFGQLMDCLIGAGVILDRGELSSCLAKLLAKGQVTRQEIERKGIGAGRRRMWRYTWVLP